MSFHTTTAAASPSPRPDRAAALALAASVLLHAAGFLVIPLLPSSEGGVEAPASLVITLEALVPPAPVEADDQNLAPDPTVPIEQAAAERDAPDPEVAEVVPESEPAAPELPAESIPELANQASELPAITPAETVPEAVAESDPDDPESPTDTAQPLPSVAMVREVLAHQQEQDRASDWIADCSPIDRLSVVKKCGDQAETDFELVEHNDTYRALNPVRQLSRSERSLSTVADNLPGLASRLEQATLPAGLAGYLLEEVEAGITHGDKLGNRAVKHMVEMTDKSAAGAIYRSISNDPWIRQRSRELSERKVHPR